MSGGDGPTAKSKRVHLPVTVYVTVSAAVLLVSYLYLKFGLLSTLFMIPLPLLLVFKHVYEAIDMNSKTTTRMSFVSSMMALGPYPAKAQVPEPTMHAILWMHELPVLADLYKLFSDICNIPSYFRLKCSVHPKLNGDAEWNLIPDRFFNIEDRFVQAQVDSQEALRKYVEEIITVPLNVTQPLWEIHVVKNTGGRSALVARFHHALGDGISMVGLFLNVFRNEDGSKVELPSGKNLDAASSPKPKGGSDDSKKRQTLQSKLESAAKTLWKVLTLPYVSYDSPLCIKDPTGPLVFSGRRKLILCEPIDLNLVKEIKNKFHVTVNDVCVAAITGAVRRYCESQKDPALNASKLSCRAMFPFGFPRPLDPYRLRNALRNLWVLISFSLPVEFPANKPVDRLKEIKKRSDQLKSSLEPLFMFGMHVILRTFLPYNMVQDINFEALMRHSMLFTNVPGPEKRVYIAGKPVDYVDPMFVGAIPQLTAVSYNGKVAVSWVVDDDFVKDPARLAECFKEELIALKDSFAGEENKNN
jgi:diacylglycerol O-acyltransferase